MARTTVGTAWATGYNDEGQLGDGSTESRSTFTQVGTEANWASVAAGAHSSIGFRS